MKISEQLYDSKGRKMNIYTCGDENGEFLFKEIMNDLALEYELLVEKLAKILSVRTLLFLQKITIDDKTGLLMSFIHNSPLLCHYKEELNADQRKELQQIVLMDILIGNKDRHAANIFVNEHLIAFDHDKLFMGKERKSSAFIKMDVGQKLDTQYVAKMEQIIRKGQVSTATALQEYFGFKPEDMLRIKSIRDQELDSLLSSLQLDEEKKTFILDFLKYRRDNFESLAFA